MTGTRRAITYVFIGLLLCSGVAVASTLDNEEQVAAARSLPTEQIASPFAAPLFLTVPTSTTTVPASVPSVPVASRTSRPRVSVPRTTVRAASAPTKSPSSADNCGGWRSYVAQWSWPVDTFCRIIGCETGHTWNPYSQNGQHRGLLQLAKKYHEKLANSLGYTWDQMVDGASNIHVGFALWQQSGTSPWNPSKYCWG